MEREVDVLVIGTGTAGYTLAMACSKAGQRVAVVDSRPFGGTCALRGCQPKKYLVEAAEVAYLSRQMSDIGIQPVAQIDWPALIRSKNGFTDAVTETTERSFEKAGIEKFHGTARFVSPEVVAVGSEVTIRAEKIVLATGALPGPLSIPGSDLVVTSDDFMNMEHLPRRIVFIGGGYISLEFAHVARAAGSMVTVVEGGDRLLEHFDADMVQQLTESARAFGIKIVTGFKATAVERTTGALLVRGTIGCRDFVEAELVVNASGRLPELGGLGLETGAVAYGSGGVTVNEYLQSVSNPRVYAIGDASGSGEQLATIADMEAGVAAENIVHGNRQRPDYTAVPSTVFTLPPLARVGMTEEQAQQSGNPFRINKGSMSEWPSSRRIGQHHGYYKIILEQDGRILGAHLLGHNAGEAINIFAMAMKFGLTNQDLQKVLWAFPTYVSDLKYMIR